MLKRVLLTALASSLVLTACQNPAPPPAASDMIGVTVQKVPLVYGDYLNRDVRDDVFYFVLPDRFHNANPANDNGSETLKISQGGLDVSSKWAFHGGDMQGLEAKLDYLEGLGITAIWMTPILRNRAIQPDGFAHHGYWIVDFTQIDPHFGSNDDLKHLIEAAHQRGMKIFFDIITNHTADVIKYRECHNPDGSFIDEKTCPYKSTEQLAAGDSYTPFIPHGEEQVKSPAWLNDPQFYNNQGDSFWQGESAINGDFVGLDDLKTSDPRVVSGFIDIYKNIISEFKPDGFRIDTVKHVDLSFWQDFGPAIMQHARDEGIPNFHIFGEVYDGNPAVLSSFTTRGKLPSVLDFGLQGAANQVFYQGKPPAAIQQLFENDDYYADHDSQADLLMNFLGNHDMGRTGHFINQHQSAANDAEKLRRSILSHAFMYLSRGVPVVYYGDEQGFTGDGGDVDAREDMFASKVASYNDNDLIGSEVTTASDNFDQGHPIYQALSKLASLRKTLPALRYGSTVARFYEQDNPVFAFSRVIPSERVEHLVVINSDTDSRTVSLPTHAQAYQTLAGEGVVKTQQEQVSVELPGLSFALLKADQPVPETAINGISLASVDALEDRRRFVIDLDTAATPLSLVEMTFEVKTASGEYRLVGKDTAAPYSLIIAKDTLADYQATDLRVTAQNYLGKTVTLDVPIAE